MDLQDSASSSSSSSSSSSNSSSADELLPPSSCSSSRPPAPSPSTSPSPKRKAGRKKFRETRHPVYHGVRARNGGRRWVCEVREPHKKTRIWLGTYPTPEMAARAHDVAAIALRGKSAPLNFPDSAHVLPRPISTSPENIRYTAARAAEMYRPSEPSSSSSSLPLPPPPPQPLPLPSVSPPPPPPPVFVDEEAIFNMYGLIQDMAVGLLLTPPAMVKGVDWDTGDSHVDWKLWSSD